VLGALQLHDGVRQNMDGAVMLKISKRQRGQQLQSLNSGGLANFNWQGFVEG